MIKNLNFALALLVLSSASCNARETISDEQTLFDDGQCRVFKRYTTPGNFWKQDTKTRIYLTCRPRNNTPGTGDIELFSTAAYEGLYTLSIDEERDGDEKILMEIVYCQYRSNDSFETVAERIKEIERIHSIVLTIDIEITENTAPCDAITYD